MLFSVFSLDPLVRTEQYLQPRSFNPDFYYVFVLGCHHFKLTGDEQHLQKAQSDTAAAEALNLSITPLTPCKQFPSLKYVMLMSTFR